MPKPKFEAIYKDLKQKIEAQEYSFQHPLPSEHTLITIYDCSRNTVRRAIRMLAEHGYVQSLQGKGVKVIYQPVEQTAFTLGGIESFKESALRNQKKAHTKVIRFSEIIADERIAATTGFTLGDELFFVQRVRYLDNVALIFDVNIFLKSQTPGLTSKIAGQSIYEYLEHQLGMQIVTSKRRMTVERATPMDEKHLDLGDYNSLAVISSQTFNSSGIMFEYTQSRHHPEYFCFQDVATRMR